MRKLLSCFLVLFLLETGVIIGIETRIVEGTVTSVTQIRRIRLPFGVLTRYSLTIEYSGLTATESVNCPFKISVGQQFPVTLQHDFFTLGARLLVTTAPSSCSGLTANP